MFYDDSIIRFGTEKGFSESYYITCPVCGNSSLRMTQWEDGSFCSGECTICRRREEVMELETLMRTSAGS
jgi:hypothetical protein